MRLALLSGGTGWHVQDLARAAAGLGHAAEAVDFRRLAAGPVDPLAAFDGVLVRTMPAGSLEQVVFRMDVLHAAELRGAKVLNPPRAVEACVDKYLTDVRLRHAALPVPAGAVCQRAADALAWFAELGGDGSAERFELAAAERGLAVRAAAAVGAVVAGVDLLPGPGGEWYVIEVNAVPGWRALSDACDIDVATAVVRHLAEECRP